MRSTCGKLPMKVRATLWFLICAFLQKGISMLTTPIFTRIMSTEEYGGYTVFNSWYNIASILVTLYLHAGFFSQGIVKHYENKDRFTASVQGLMTALLGLWTLIYLLFADFWNGLTGMPTSHMLAMLVLCWTTACFTCWSVEQRVDYRYRNLVIVTLLVSLLKPLVGILLVTWSEDKVSARIFGLLLVELLFYAWTGIRSMVKAKCFFDRTYWKTALLFALPLVPHYLSQTVLSSSDRIMIENLVGQSQAGIYGLAAQISMIMMLFSTAFGQTISPWMFRKIKFKQYDDIPPVAYLTLVFIAVVNLLLILMAPEVIAIFAPPAYGEAIWCIPPIAMSTFFIFMYDYFARFEFYYEKNISIMLASIFGAVLNIILNYVCIRAFGYQAAGYTTLVCYMVYAACHYVFMRKLCRKEMDDRKVYDVRILLGISGAFVVVGFLFMLTYSVPVLRYALFLLMLLGIFLKRKLILTKFFTIWKTIKAED